MDWPTALVLITLMVCATTITIWYLDRNLKGGEHGD